MTVASFFQVEQIQVIRLDEFLPALLVMSSNDFNHAKFITEVGTKSYEQLTWIAEEEGKVFTRALGWQFRTV